MERKRRFQVLVSSCVLILTTGCAHTLDRLGDLGRSRGDEPTRTVVISEINYHDISGRDDEDYIELFNSRSTSVDLGGWCIGGIEFCFDSPTEVLALSHVVVRGEQFGGRLGNDAENLVLVDSRGRVVDRVRYGSRAPWPADPDGRGETLHRLSASQTAESVDAWIADVPSPGSAYDPGARTRPRADVTLVVNEVSFHPPDDDPTSEYVELRNIASVPVSLDGWCLPELQKCFRGGPVVEPGAMHVVRSPAPEALGNRRGVVRLIDSAGRLRDVARYEDRGEWPAMADGHGHSVHRRDPRLVGYEPGNWESAEMSPGSHLIPPRVGFLPMLESVTHTARPRPGQEIVVNARVRDGESVVMVHKIGFGEEIETPMQKDSNGLWRGVIPSQPAGALVRYRLIAVAGEVRGTWPRQGDGTRYDGTVVDSPGESALPRIQWFVPDDEYEQIYADRNVYRDDGFSTVIAHDGMIFDNALIRVRGNQSRQNDKKKWKVVLPPGRSWDMGGRLLSPVDEFALNSAVTDKSFVREILTSDLQRMGGGIGQQVLPVRLEKNGEFYGLYLYQEQPDGAWRRKNGFSDETVAFKSDLKATLNVDQLDMTDEELRRRYQQRSRRHIDGIRLIRDLIRKVNADDPAVLEAFVRDHVDVPQVVEAIATMRVAQHLEWEHKNHLLLYDPSDEKWRIVPIDFDLNFGRRFVTGCNAFCEEVEASGYMDYMEANKLTRIILKTKAYRMMVDRRTRTLADTFLAEGLVEARIAELEMLMRDDAARDRKRWYTYGEQQSMQRGQQILVEQYFVPKRRLLIGADSTRLPAPQLGPPAYVLTDGEMVRMTNPGSVAVDVSGVELSGLGGVVPAGTVLPPGYTVVIDRQRGPRPSGLGPTDLHVSILPER